MKRISGLLVIGLVMLGASPAFAMRTKMHEMAESQQYGRKAGGMIGRGALNVVTCFVDPIVNIVNETKVGPPLVGTLTGLGKGVGCGVLRLGSGAVDLVTFWVPGFNGAPVSDSYENCMAPSGASSSYDATVQEVTPAAYPPAQNWDVPTTEPGAAQPPVSEEPAQPKRKWTK